MLRTTLLPPLLSLAACTPVRFTAQDLHLCHDPEADTLELTLVYEGLTARPPAVGVARRGGPPEPLNGDQPLAEAERWVRRLAAGERVFILLDWPFVFDLENREEEDDHDDPRLRALVDSIELVEARLFVDERDRLGALQRLRWNDLSTGLAAFNEALNAFVLEDMPPEEEFAGHPETRGRMLAHARANRAWLAFDRGALVVRIPLAPQDFAHGLRELVAEGTERDARAVARGVLTATSVSLDEEGLHLRYEPAEDGTVRLRFERPEVEYDGRLRAVLTFGGVELQEGKGS